MTFEEEMAARRKNRQAGMAEEVCYEVHELSVDVYNYFWNNCFKDEFGREMFFHTYVEAINARANVGSCRTTRIVKIEKVSDLEA